MIDDVIIKSLSQLSGTVYSDPTECAVFASDGSGFQGTPTLVVIPQSSLDIAETVKIAHREGIGLVPRGSGTGLSGAAAPVADQILVSCARIQGIDTSRIADGIVKVACGTTVHTLQSAALENGWRYGPDPANSEASTVGGSIASKRSGPSAWTGQNTSTAVIALEMILSDGSDLKIGSLALDRPGVDLVGLVVGSEGTLGFITQIVVGLERARPKSGSVIAVFRDLDYAIRTGEILASEGIDLCALEVMDPLLADAARRFSPGFPTPIASSLLLAKAEGNGEHVDAVLESCSKICAENGAISVCQSGDEKECESLWLDWDKTFGTVGNIGSEGRWISMTVPPEELSNTVVALQQLVREHQRRAGWLIHVGDGGIQGVLFDSAHLHNGAADPLLSQIRRLCISAGGTGIGEHGIGRMNSQAMSVLCNETSLTMMRKVKAVFDPKGLMNSRMWPPSRADRRKSRSVEHIEYRTVTHLRNLVSSIARANEPSVVEPRSAKETARILRAASEDGVSVAVQGTPSSRMVDIRLDKLQEIGQISVENRSVTVQAGVQVRRLQGELARVGLRWGADPSDAMSKSVGQAIAFRSNGPRRMGWGDLGDNVISVEMATPRGDLITGGGPQIRSRTGYDLRALAIGARHSLGIVTEATLRLHPLPQHRMTLFTVFGTLSSCKRAVASWQGPLGEGNIVDPVAVVVMVASGELEVGRNWQIALHKGQYTVLLCFEGGEEAVRNQIASAVDTGNSKGMFDHNTLEGTLSDNVWLAISMMRHVEGVDWNTHSKINIHVPRTRTLALLGRLKDEVSQGSDLEMVADVGCGVLEALIIHDETVSSGWLTTISDLVVDAQGWMEVTHGPFVDSVSLNSHGTETELQERLKDALDPKAILPNWFEGVG